MFKTLTFVNRRPDISREAFSLYWRTDHGRIVEESPALRRHIHYYVQHHVTETLGKTAPPMPFDGVVELAFLDREAARRFFREPDYLEKLRPDELAFVDLERVYTVVVEDRLFVGDHVPPPADTADAIVLDI